MAAKTKNFISSWHSFVLSSWHPFVICAHPRSCGVSREPSVRTRVRPSRVRRWMCSSVLMIKFLPRVSREEQTQLRLLPHGVLVLPLLRTLPPSCSRTGQKGGGEGDYQKTLACCRRSCYLIVEAATTRILCLLSYYNRDHQAAGRYKRPPTCAWGMLYPTA